MIDISVNHPDNFLTYSLRLRTFASQEFGRYFPISLMCRNEILMTAAPRGFNAWCNALGVGL